MAGWPGGGIARVSVTGAARVPPLAPARYAHALRHVELLESRDEARGRPSHRGDQEPPRHRAAVGRHPHEVAPLGSLLHTRARSDRLLSLPRRQRADTLVEELGGLALPQ